MKAAKTTNQDTYDVLSDNLSKMKELTDRIGEVKNEARNARFSSEQYARDMRELRNKINGYSPIVESQDKRNDKNQYYRALLSNAERDYERAKTEHDKCIDKLENLNSLMKQLEQEYADICQGASIDQVLTHQRHIATVVKKIEDLLALIADQEAAAYQATAGEDPLDGLMTEREALLAKITLGEADKKELAKLDENIAKIDDEYKKNQIQQMGVLRHSRQTAAGLQRRLSDEESELDRLNNMTPQVIEQFLITEGEQLAKEYNEIAQQAAQKIKRLAVLDKMATDIGGHMGAVFLHHSWKQTFLPKTLIASLAGHQSLDVPAGALFDMRTSGFILNNEIASEIEQMSHKGVVYPAIKAN